MAPGKGVQEDMKGVEVRGIVDNGTISEVETAGGRAFSKGWSTGNLPELLGRESKKERKGAARIK